MYSYSSIYFKIYSYSSIYFEIYSYSPSSFEASHFQVETVEPLELMAGKTDETQVPIVTQQVLAEDTPAVVKAVLIF